MKKQKDETITFKVDRSLLEAMRGIQNRSNFIRESVLAALQNACPLCRGTGILTPNQKKHWDALGKDHFFEDCKKCHEVYLTCGKTAPKKAAHSRERQAGQHD